MLVGQRRLHQSLPKSAAQRHILVGCNLNHPTPGQKGAEGSEALSGVCGAKPVPEDSDLEQLGTS